MPPSSLSPAASLSGEPGDWVVLPGLLASPSSPQSWLGFPVPGGLAAIAPTDPNPTIAPEMSIATMNLRIRFPPWSLCSALAPRDAAPADFFPNLPQQPKARPPPGTAAGAARASLLGRGETRRRQGAAQCEGYSRFCSTNQLKQTATDACGRSPPLATCRSRAPWSGCTRGRERAISRR